MAISAITSSGAGDVGHFSEVFGATNVEVVLAAGILRRREVHIFAAKEHLRDSGIKPCF